MSREAIRLDAALLARPGMVVTCHDVGEQVAVVLEGYELPVDSVYEPENPQAIAFLVPEPYPDAQPDPSGFYVKPAAWVVATTRQAPKSTGQAPLLGETWLKFSWKPKTVPWDPTKDTLDTFLGSIDRRFLHRE